MIRRENVALLLMGFGIAVVLVGWALGVLEF